MKIIHFINALGSGGAEKVMYDTINGLDKEFTQEVLVLSVNGIYRDKLGSAGISVRKLTLKIFMQFLFEPKKNTIAVVGILKDKDVYSLVKPMVNNVDKWFCGTINSERGMNSDEIKTRMSGAISDNNIETFETIDEACIEAIKSLRKEDRLIVYGSFYTVSEFLDYYESIKQDRDIIK